MGLEQKVGHQIEHGNTQHDGETNADLPRGCDLAGHAPADHSAPHDAANGDEKTPEELLRRQLQMLPQKHRRAQDVEEHAIEWDTTGQGQQKEARVRAQLPVACHQVPGMKILSLRDVQGFRQRTVNSHPQDHAHTGQKPEDAVPTDVHQHPAAHHGRNGRSDAKENGDLTHDLLGLRGREHVAYDRP